MRRPHRRGSGPACGRVLRKRRERVQARFLLRGGDSGAGPQRVIKGSQPTQRNTLGLARGSAPSNPDPGEPSPGPLSHPPLPSPSTMTDASLAHHASGQIGGAYRRSDLFERRCRLMDDWAGYLAGPSREPHAGAALDGLPAGDHFGESDLPARGGKGCPDPCPPLPSPVAHQRRKGGSLSPPAPLSCGAPLRRARGGRARRSLASPFRRRRGKSVLSGVRCAVSQKSPHHNGEGSAL